MRRDRTRDKDSRARTISISLRERGQTTQDFAIGIGVFLLAIAFVFSFLPSLVTPFESSAGGAETAQADRIADRIVHETSTETPNELNGSEFAEYDGNLTNRLGLRANDDDVRFDRVNVSVERLNETENEPIDDTLTAGDVYNNQSAASSARIVTTDHDDDDCDPACRLVVRVW